MEYRSIGRSLAFQFLMAAGVSLPLISQSSFAAGPASWGNNFTESLKQAAEKNQSILVTVTAVWCGPCRQMQQLTFSNPEFSQFAAENFVTVSIDGDQHPDVVSRLEVGAFPTTLVVDAAGTVRHRWVGFQSASTLKSELQVFARKSSGTTIDFPAVSALFPTNASPYGFGAFCLVSLLDDNQLRRGVDAYPCEYRGVKLCFYSAAHREKFLAQPERYWPVDNGNCLVTSRENQVNAPGDPRVGVLWRNRLWFFADRERQRRFMEAPDRFSEGRL